MAERYECPDCGHVSVLEAGCGVAHTLLCPTCGMDMVYISRVETQWVGHEECEHDYEIVEEDL